MSKLLTRDDYQAAADLLRTGVAEVKSVRDVESSGRGFLADGRIIIRFEGHRFRQYTKGKFDQKYPTISHPYMRNCPYNKGVKSDYLRLKIAMALDPTAALKSCSWGMFQIMGDEFWRCGFKDVHKFVDFLKTGEGAQLLAFARFNISKELDDFLRKHMWREYSEGYNGEDFEALGYHLKLPKRLAYHLANPDAL